MGRFSGAPTKATVGFVTLDKDRYEFQLGEPKAYKRTQKSKDGGDDKIVEGIRWPLTVISPEGRFKGKTVTFTSSQDNEISLNQEKALMMAADGAIPKPENEEEWNSAHGGDDFSADSDTGVVGEGYRQYKGRVVAGELDITPDKTDPNKIYQKWVRWEPVTE